MCFLSSIKGRSVFSSYLGWLHRTPRTMKLHEVRCRLAAAARPVIPYATQAWTPLFPPSKHFLERGPNKAKAGQASIRSSLKVACSGRQRWPKGPDSPGKRAVEAVAANKEAYLPGRNAGREPGRPFRAKREAVPKCLGKISTQLP